MSRKSFAYNVIYQYGFQAAKYLIPFITLPYLTRVLGSDAYGVRVYVLAVMSFVQIIIDFGFLQYGTKLISQFDINVQHQREVSLVVSRLTFAKIMLSLIVAIILVMLALFVPLLSQNIVYLFIAYLAVVVTSLLPDFVFMGFGQMRILTTRFVISKIIPTVLVFVLIHSSADLLWVPALDLLAAITAAILTLRELSHNYGVSLVRASIKDAISDLKASGVYFIGNAACTVFNSLTTIVVGIYGSASDVAFWGVSLSALSIMQAIYSPISNALYPHMLRERDKSLFIKLFVLSALAMLVLSMAFYVCADLIVLLLGGADYTDAIPILQAISPLVLLSYLNILLGLPFMGAVGLVPQMTKSAVISATIYTVCLISICLIGLFSLPAVCLLRVGAEVIFICIRVIMCVTHREIIAKYFDKGLMV